MCGNEYCGEEKIERQIEAGLNEIYRGLRAARRYNTREGMILIEEGAAEIENAIRFI